MYHHIQGKNQSAIATYLAVMCAAKGKQNAQHGNNQVNSIPRQIIKHGNKQMPTIHHMTYSPMHDTS
jgi:anthranilate phosphoribosyltransferase